MKIFSQNYKILKLLILFLVILIPIFVWSYDNHPSKGYRVDSGTEIATFHNLNNDVNNLEILGSGICVTNTSTEDVFVPTRTISEWNKFASSTLNHPELGLSLNSCCGDGVCQSDQEACQQKIY